MNKKIFIGLSCVLLANSSYAWFQNSTPNLPLQGVYFLGGVDSLNANLKFPQQTSAVLNDPGFLPETQKSNNSNYDYANEIAGTLALGYNQVISTYILGLEARANLTNAQVDTNINTNSSGLDPALPHEILNTNITINVQDSYSLLFKPGFLIDNTTLLYFLVGPIWGHYKISDQATFSHSVVSGGGAVYPIDGSTSSSTSGYKTGVNAGVGIEKYIYKGLGVGLEYDYAYYGNLASVSSTGNITTTAPGFGAIGTLNTNLSHVTLQTNVFMFNLFYHV